MYCFDFYKTKHHSFLTWATGFNNLADLYIDYEEIIVQTYSDSETNISGFELKISTCRDATSVIIVDIFPSCMIDLLILTCY